MLEDFEIEKEKLREEWGVLEEKIKELEEKMKEFEKEEKYQEWSQKAIPPLEENLKDYLKDLEEEKREVIKNYFFLQKERANLTLDLKGEKDPFFYNWLKKVMKGKFYDPEPKTTVEFFSQIGKIEDKEEKEKAQKAALLGALVENLIRGKEIEESVLASVEKQEERIEYTTYLQVFIERGIIKKEKERFIIDKEKLSEILEFEKA